jgi:septum formation protein
VIVLASGSAARRTLLEAAGLRIAVDPARLDEAPLKLLLRDQNAGPARIAAHLAEAKAAEVSARTPNALVIGADQTLDLDGAEFDKPRDRAEARAQLQALRGRTHRLISAVAVLRDGEIRWTHAAEARLAMRDCSDAFLDEYLDRVGPAVQHSVGAYQLEGLGAQLFTAIEGDFFTILGLPLLPLLEFLRIDGELTR